ncbi:MAG: PRC-barrel domain-containing protein [Rubricoccaceae bacterium]|nr:PRC-barrel domain-containing protein [Rubricoccaceae bacterium]
MTILSASTLMNDPVVNPQGEDLGKIEDFVLDTKNGRVEYAVLSFGGLFGIGDKLFAVPLEAFRLDTTRERLTLDVTKERLENAPGFDKDHWPKTADRSFTERAYSHWGVDYRRERDRVMEPVLN